MNWPRHLNEVEDLLRAGRLGVAARLLTEMPAVPRPNAARFAQLARRAQLDHLSLRTLAPYVRAEDRGEPSALETIEYAASLQKIGAVREARARLSDPRLKGEATASLYLAFAHFRHWEYAEAVPHLERYLRADLDPYARALGELNLAAALVTSDASPSAAEDALAQLKHTAYAAGLNRILINTLEVEAQLHLRQRDFASARTALARAEELRPEGSDAFWIEKWTAVLDLEQHGDARPLARFSREASRKGEWESVRDADYHRLKAHYEADCFARLYFGTPYAAYRERLRTFAPPEIPRTWRLGAAEAPAFDLETGEITGGPVPSPTNGIHRVIDVLTRDLYRPARLGDVFDGLYPGEHYDPHSSPNRVHQIVARARRWIEAHAVPLDIQSVDGAFRLALTGRFAVVIPGARAAGSSRDVQIQRMHQTFGNAWFSPREARAALNLSTSAFKRAAAAAVTDGRLERLGAGRAILYKIAG